MYITDLHFQKTSPSLKVQSEKSKTAWYFIFYFFFFFLLYFFYYIFIIYYLFPLSTFFLLSTFFFSRAFGVLGRVSLLKTALLLSKKQPHFIVSGVLCNTFGVYQTKIKKLKKKMKLCSDTVGLGEVVLYFTSSDKDSNLKFLISLITF
jgi:hypothetical protein